MDEQKKLVECTDIELLDELYWRIDKNHKRTGAKIDQNDLTGEEKPKSDEKVEQFSARCADCGKETTVPFRPKQGWPVRCMQCYLKKKGVIGNGKK
jgi:CxxC-x17-CxxC domain-containing protein